MSTGAIVMMLIGCIGLWGGFALSVGIAIRHGMKEKQNASESISE